MDTSGGSTAKIIQLVEDNLAKRRNDANQNRRSTENFTIFRVPLNLDSVDSCVYQPRVISIGPYHHGNPNLTAMENHKLFYLEKLIHWIPNVSLKSYVEKMLLLEDRARNCYSDDERMNIVDKNKFIEILVVDSCFLFMLVLRPDLRNHHNSPIRGLDWSLALVLTDLLKLENQIPFFIIQELVQMTGIFDANSFIERLIELYSTCLGILTPRDHNPHQQPFDHFLHLFQVSFKTGIIQQVPKIKNPSALVRKTKEFRTVMQLLESGVKFTPKSGRCILDITFENGVLEFPHISIDETFKVFLHNMVSLEQCNVKYGNHFTSYACFINNLVDSPGDVTILEQKKVFANLLGSNENVADVFNQLGLGVIHHTTSNYLHGVEDEMKEYCGSRWPRWRGMLVRDYFNNPWVITSLIAGFAVLLLTFLQTYYTMLPFYFP